ncbi:MAG: tetratricopeptide repeat protein [Actinomycetota bacterium]|nr:tetratricopeptide repeat protein [Actinomycetota bacterium]MDI6821828.1 tetratricopeptide repeat protein [Actinomycetota bacterium]
MNKDKNLGGKRSDGLPVGRHGKFKTIWDGIIHWSLFLLVFLFPLLVNPFLPPIFTLPKLTFLRILTIVMLFAWSVKVIKSGRIRFIRTTLNIPVLALAFVAILTTITSVHFLTALFGEYSRWEGSLTFLNYLLIFFIATNFVSERRQYDLLLFGLLLSASLVSILSIIEQHWTNFLLLYPKVHCPAGLGKPSGFEMARSFATFGNPMYLSAYLTLVLPLALAIFMKGSYPKRLKVLLPLSITLMLICLVFTYARAAWLGFAMSFLFIVFLSLRDIWANKKMVLVFMGMALICALFVNIPSKYSAYTITQRMTSIVQIEEGSAVPRLKMWRQTLPLIADRPFLGSGADTYKLVFPKYKPKGWVIAFRQPLLDKAHNDFLQVAATMGLLGLAAYLWFLGTFFLKGIRTISQTEHNYERALLIGVIAGALGYVVQLQFNFSHLSVAPLFWLFAGLACTIQKNRKWEWKIFAKSRRLAWIIYGASGLIALLLILCSLIPLIADTYFSKALNYQHEKRLEEAISCYERAASLYPLEELYLYSLGRAYSTKAFSAKDPEYARLYIILAADVFNRSQKLNPWDENAFFYAGNMYLRAGKVLHKGMFANAIEAYSRGLKLNPTSADAHLNLGVALAYQGDFEEAISQWEKTLAIDPGKVDAHYNIGWVYERMGLLSEAKKAYQKALEINPSYTDAKRALERLQNP